jgi:hypothetical protein
MPRYRRMGRKSQTTLPLGTTPSESFGRYSTARNTTGRDGRWRLGRTGALCGKSPLKWLSQITMAEAPIALRTSHRRGC